MAGITTKKVDRVYPFEVLIDHEGGLSERSKAMLMQLRSIDRRRIQDRYGRLSDSTMTAVDGAVRIATGLAAL